MSLGFKPCPKCPSASACGEAEALIAVDGLVEWFCITCDTHWTEPATTGYEAERRTHRTQRFDLEQWGDEF